MKGLQAIFALCVLQLALTRSTAQLQARGDIIRLVNGSAPNEGRVLIRWSPDSPWTAVCYDPSSFSHAIPFQMCSRLGYPFACGQDYAGAHRTDEASLVNIPSESHHVACSANQNDWSSWGCSLFPASGLDPSLESRCTHNQDMWLTCGYAGMPNFELRLVEGSLLYPKGLLQGRCGVEHEWSAVCANRFLQPKHGRVACRELRHSDQAVDIEYLPLDDLDAQHKPNFTLFVDIGCAGNETSLTECQHNSRGECERYVTLECYTGITEYARTAYLCGSKQLCGDQCQQNHPINGSADDEFHYCQCDDLCGLFDDCCYDYAGDCSPSSPSRPSLERGGFTLDQFGCVWVPGSQFTHIGYVAVDRCPISWADEGTRDLCERPVNITDVMGSLPVYDDQGVDFKNIYCAICNRRSFDMLKRWDVSGSDNKRQVTRTKMYPSLNQSLPTKGWVITPPPGHAVIRECPANLVDTCLELFRSTELEDGCKAYYAPVKVEDSDTRYRNPHCAMCNGWTVAPESSCRDQRCTGSCASVPWGPCAVFCGPYDDFLTIEVLFDFSSSSSTGGISCSEGKIYDPFLEKCRVLRCATGYEIKGEECVIAPFISPLPSNRSETPAIECLWRESVTSSSEVATMIEHVNTEIDPRTSSTLSVSVLVRSAAEAIDVEIAFDDTIKTGQNNTLLNSSLPCNISQFSIFLPFSFNGSSYCNNYTLEGSDVFPGYKGRLLTEARFRSTLTGHYAKEKVASSCLKINDLSCPSLLLLEEKEYSIVSEESIRVLATGARLNDGGYVLLIDGTAVVCSYITQTPEGLEPQIRRAISFAGTCLSLLALAATFVTYCLFPVLRNTAGLSTMHLVVALFTAILVFLLSGFLASSQGTCEIGAMVAHYAWLVAFFWMTVLSVTVAYTLTSMVPRSGRNPGVSRALIAYACLAWGIPLVIVCICLILQYCDCASLPVIYAEGGVCWITDATTRLVAFTVPMALCLAFNLFLYVFTLVNVRRTRDSSRVVRTQGRLDEAKEELAIYGKLSALVGVTWVFGFISQSVTGILVFSYIYIILNYLQGVFIFIAFCLNKRVRGLWREKLRRCRRMPKKEVSTDPKHSSKESALTMLTPKVIEEDTKF